MTKIERNIRRETGYGDVVRSDPKPTAAGHWNKSIRAARQYADGWAREYVKQLYPFCVTCGSRDNLTWAHVLSGKGDAVKWEERNMTRQCAMCNSAHESNPEPLVTWFLRQYGQPALFALTLQANTSVKRTYAQIMKFGDKYREKVRE
jgi:hypothetical protein